MQRKVTVETGLPKENVKEEPHALGNMIETKRDSLKICEVDLKKSLSPKRNKRGKNPQGAQLVAQ